MKIPFGTMSIPQKSKDLISEILNSNRVSSGRYVREFEKNLPGLPALKRRLP